MKQFSHYIFSILAVCSLVLCQPTFAGSKDKKEKKDKTKETAQAQPKISRTDAAKAVMFAWPGATVDQCDVVNGSNGHANWSVTFGRPDIRGKMQVEVDGITGKVLQAPSGKVDPGKPQTNRPNSGRY